MATTIQDGTGTGQQLKITELSRALTDSITEERAVFNSVEQGNTFLVVSDFLTFTGSTGVENGIIYIKNNSDKKMLVHHIKLWNGSSGTGQNKIRTYRNPTTGTLISGANTATIENINFGSANTYEGLGYQGDGTALTVTDGDIFGRYYFGGGSGMYSAMWNGAIVLEKSNSLAVTVEPQNGQVVSMCCEIEVYFE